MPRHFNKSAWLCRWSFWALLLLTTATIKAQTLSFDQAQVVAVAGLNEGFAFGRATTADEQGNVYITGNFGGTQRFGNITLTAATIPPGMGFDVYVVKFAPNGQVLWAVRGGGISDDYSRSIALDGQGNVYVAGSYIGRTASYGSTTLQNNGTNNGSFFIAKLNARTGQWQWAVSSSDGGVAEISGLAIDRAGSVLATGYLGYSQQGPTTLGPFTLPNAGFEDIVVGKLDQAGHWRWAVAVGGTGAEAANSIALDEEGNGYVTGRFSSQQIGFGAHTLMHSQVGSSSSDDVFVAKIDSAGTWQWATGAGRDGIDRGIGITTDNQRRVFITGVFSRDADFGSKRLTSSGYYDMFTACLSQSGTWQWAVAGGGPGYDAGVSITADKAGYVYVGGSFYLSGNSVAQFGSTTLHSAGTSDVFVARLDSLGNYSGAIAAGGLLEDDCSGVTAVGSKVYLTGTISTSINVSPNARFGRYTLAANPTTYGRMYTAWAASLTIPPRGTQPSDGNGGNGLDNWDARASLPNIITPNNDGYNDYFAPKNFPTGPWQLTIYNRWGTHIYHTADYQSDWGTEATGGIYYYLLRHQATNHSYKGWLEVVR